MPLTRAQYIQGDGSQGKVLPGEVQGVKQGAGTIIAADGTISFYPETAVGIVKLNNTSAYNSYVWPNVVGQSGTFLGVDNSGKLAWLPPPGLVSLGNAPIDPRLGQLWFDYDTNLTYVYQDRGSVLSWYPVYRGVEPLPTYCTADPAFSNGDGSLENPFSLGSVTSRNGNTVLFPTTVTISGLAPFQYVPILDLNEFDNNYRFQVTNNFADGEGVLTFKVKFTDYPQTPPGTAYSAKFRIGFDEPFYVSTAIGITFPVSIQSVGSITGSPVVGQVLTYSGGLATGGTPPYNYTWSWKLETGGTPLQTNGNTYVVSPSAVGNRVYVQLTATDASLDQAVGNTGTLPSSPNLITKGMFPVTDILYPTTIPGSATTIWQDAGTTLRSNGCIEFSVDNVTYNQGPTVVANGGTLATRWMNSPSCSGADNGVTIAGCIYNDFYQDCATLLIDKVPSPFSFPPVTNVTPNTVTSSLAITPVGFNSVAYVTYNGVSTGLSIQGSTNGGTTWTTLPLNGGTDLPISPGDSLRVRMTVGSNYLADYSAIINIGVGTTVQSATFTATTAQSTIFSTLISFPTITTQEISSTAWLLSDGPTSLSATGCIQFKVNSGGTWKGAGDSPTAILTGDILYTRWSNALPNVCGNATHGTVITGTISNTPSGGSKTSSASLTIDRVPSVFSFTDLNNQAASSVITSNSINISGTNAPAFLTYGASSTLTSLQASIGGGAWVSIPSSGETLSIAPVASGLGTTLKIRGTTGSGTNQTYTATINIGQNTSINTTTWSVATAAIIPSITTPSILTPANGATNLNPNNNSPAGFTITSSPYTPINGASATHASTDWEIRKVSTSGTIVVNTNSITQLTSYFLAASLVEANTAYFVRCRYTSGGSPVISQWSPWSQFNTATTFGLNWVVRNVGGSAQSYYGTIVWAGAPVNRFVSVGYAPSNSYKCYLSPDGITWTKGGTLGAYMYDIAYDNGVLVAVGSDSLGGAVRVSTTGGDSWSSSVPNCPELYSVAIKPGITPLVVAVGRNGTIITSTNITAGSPTWQTRTPNLPAGYTNAAITSVIWDGTQFKATATFTTTSSGYPPYINFVLTSLDGITWSSTGIIAIESTNFKFGKIYYLGAGYIVIGQSNAAGQSTDYLYYYGDGLTNWTAGTAVLPPYSPSYIGNEIKDLAVGANFITGGTGGAICLTSPRSAYPPTFSVTTPFSLSTFASVAYSDTLNRFVAMGGNDFIYST